MMPKMMKMWFFFFVLVVTGCGGGGNTDDDPCRDQDCSGHGTCVVKAESATCNCDDGYHAEGLACVEDTGDVCDGVTCSGHGTCFDDGGSPACDCDDGHHAEGLACVEDTGDVCEGVTCSGHGSCFDDGGSPACDCDDGYHAEGLACVEDTGDVCDGVTCSGHGTCFDDGGSAACDCDDGYRAEGLACVLDTPEDWPPDVDELYEAGVGCNLPACDEDGDAGFQPEGTWTSTVTCLESNCSAVIQNSDKRAKPGTVTTEEGIAMGQFIGSCGVDDQGNHTATAYAPTVASCETSDEMMGVVSYQAVVMTFDGDTATGHVHVYLTDVPAIAGGDCDFLSEVLYEKE